ncbi:sensor histidine kinase [Streptomyces sp. NPDC059582]|uniref:sensor histidine kinase n=1 Tax=Streptomyces sp. NPDC059582 TaxID=3346875 RepID=UPI0036952AA0
MAAADASGRRIERDLHDGVQQRLVSLQLDLRTAQAMLEEQPDDLAAQLEHIAGGLDDACDDPLRVVRGIHPAILSRGGPGPAPRAPPRRASVPVEPDLRLPPGRLPEPTQVAVYYVTSEALTNPARHARAAVVQTSARPYERVLEVSIHDDGVGGAEPGRGSGLGGLTPGRGDRRQADGQQPARGGHDPDRTAPAERADDGPVTAPGGPDFRDPAGRGLPGSGRLGASRRVAPHRLASPVGQGTRDHGRIAAARAGTGRPRRRRRAAPGGAGEPE